VRKTNLKNGLKARVAYTEAGIILQLLPGDPPGPLRPSFSHQNRHPGDDGAEDIIIFKGQHPPQGNLTSSVGS
jgi:hypothetical protein